MWKNYLLSAVFLTIFSWNATSQVGAVSKPVFSTSSKAIPTPPISEKELLPPISEVKIFNPRNRGSNSVVPGKGYPKTVDAAWQKKSGKISAKKPIVNFDASTSGSKPTDPTGSVGPNHYVNAWNHSFAVYDKKGNILSPPANLSSIGGTFEGENDGDPIMAYDSFADRFILSQLSASDEEGVEEAFLVAVSKGPDPIHDGWYTYRFETGNALPDYPKLSVWSDGYYITTNKESLTAGSSEVIYVLEREKMLEGEDAKSVGFPLPGISTNGFYSPAGFYAVGKEMPPPGNAPIIYFQDDAWRGVNEDHLKIWLINVDWENVDNSTIAESQNLGSTEGVTPFISTFDGGSFTNLEQSDPDLPEIDALQGAVMYMTPYRRFPDHNAVVLNFVVDVDGSAAEHAGIRWYELRQKTDGDPWTVYQEGTYAPDNSDRFCGSIGIDASGNIGIGYTVLNNNPEKPVHPSLRYTGRYAGDRLGEMTIREQSIVEGPSPNLSSRYGDYSHMTIDPVNDHTFWFIGEYFVDQERRNRVGVFELEPDAERDVGIVDVISPQSSTLGKQETVTVLIRNFGLNPQTDIPIEFSIDGGETYSEIFTGSLTRTSEEEFTFSTKVDLSEVGRKYEIVARTNLSGDENHENDEYSEIIENLTPIDVGVTGIDAPTTGLYQNLEEEVTISIQNFGGEPQSDIPVIYTINDSAPIKEVFPGPLEVGEEVSFTFNTPVDISTPGTYSFYAATALPDDANPSNDGRQEVIANLSCIPEGADCSYGDGVFSFYLGDIVNENILCNSGYADYIGYSTELDRTREIYELALSARYASGEKEKFSMWIDFNDNGSFEEDELLISDAVISQADTKFSYEFSIPRDAALGEHVIRIRAGDTSFGGDLNNPCSVMEFGTTHDYSVVIVDSSMSLPDMELQHAELVISSKENDIYDISMITSYEESLRISVHNLLGQTLVEQKVKKRNGIYYYQLDMSYAASGVYLVRLGTRKVGRVRRIIVR